MAHSHPLAGRRILVTGATSGIGERMALDLAASHGAHVIATGRRVERLQELASKVNEAGGTIETHPLDLTDEDAIDALTSSLTIDGIDDLVLNAGVTSAEPFVDGSAQLDQSIVTTNVSANLQLIRALIEPLSQNKTGGRILLIASLGGLVPLPYQAVYAGSKAFLINFGLSLREELKAHGICVLLFAPGGVATEMTDIDAMAKLQNQLASVESVSAQALQMFIARRALVVPGLQNKLTALIARLLPRQLMARIAETIYRNARADTKP